MQTPLAVATISPLPGASLDSAYTTTLLSTGGTAGYSWDVSSGVLPNGITLASNGTFSGIPTATGSFTFTVRVTDSVPDTATCSVTLHVSTTAVAVTTSSLPDGTAGIAYNQSLSASGGEGSYVWSLTSGTLQSGLSLSSAGVISGTPIVAATRSITVKVTDSGNRSASAVLSLTTTPSPLNITTSYLNKAVSNVAYTASFAASGGTVPYTLSLQSGTLPSGLSFANGVISGKTSVLGSTNLSVLVTDGLGVTATKAFTLTVINKAVAPIMDTPVFPTLMISTLFSHQLTAKEFPKTFTATGLPKGLVIAATTGLITGRPTVSGVYNVLVNAANTGGTSPTVTVKLIVQALPNNAVGTFVGHIARNSTVNGSLGGRVDLTTTSTGTYTLKLTQGGKVTSLKGNLTTSANSTPAVSITSASISVALSLPNDTITGDVTVSTSPAAVVGWRRVWNTTLNPAVKQVGYYTTGIDLTTDVGVDTIPQGTGYASFSIGLDGGLTVSGKTSDGSSITSAGFMGPNGEILVHQVLYTNLGSLLGQLNLTTDTNGDFTENRLAGSLTWKKPAIATSRTYPNSFDLILGVAGKYISASSSSGIVLGLPEVNTNATLEFAEGGIGSSALNPNVSFTLSDVYKPILPTAGGFDNPAKTTLILTTKNGVISGAASLVDGAVKRALTYQGLIVRGADASTKAYGYFLLPQIPTSGQTATTAPILSGQVTINQ
ncbi:MAG: putative Ig domain-containing protein [Verrucomicrobia bacterium]|nr:putative Ig domain-containing protein [Verrucomicrobiota bacterium]